MPRAAQVSEEPEAPDDSPGRAGAQPPRLTLLGPPRLHRPGHAPAALERHDAALLAMLVTKGPTARAVAAARLWPDSSREQALSNLRQRLFRLRASAGGDLVLGQAMLALAPSVRHDLDPATAGADPEDVGELLAGLDYSADGELGDWVEQARRDWRERRHAAITQRLDALEAADRLADALPLAEALLRADADRDESWLRLVGLHYRSGDHDRARAAAGRYRVHLVERAAVPSAAMRQLLALVDDSAPPNSPGTVLPLAVQRPPRMIGREQAWALVQQAHAVARVPVLLGEAGIGKSRFVADWGDAFRGSLRHAASIGDERLPWSTFGALLQELSRRFGPPGDDAALSPLADHLPGLGEPPAGCTAAHRVEAFVQALARWQGRGLSMLLIDDLHWADDESAQTLLAAAIRPEALVRWLFASRRGEGGSELAHWLDEAGPRHATLIELAALDAQQVHELLGTLAPQARELVGWAQALCRQGLGNPMHMLALLAAQLHEHGAGVLDAPVADRIAAPSTLLQMLDRTIARLSPGARQLAQVAALARGHFGAGLAVDVLGLPPLRLNDAWVELEQRLVLRRGDLAHDTWHERLIASVAEPLARVVHRRIAEIGAAHGVDVATRARHWQLAACFEQAAAAYEEAAGEARARHAHEQEVAHLDAAAACLDAAGRRAEAFAVRARAADTALAMGGSAALRTRVDALAAAAVDACEELRALLLVLRERLLAHDLTAAPPLAAAAVGQAEALVAQGVLPPHDALRLRASMLLGSTHAQRGAYAEAITELQRLAPLVAQTDDRRLRMDHAGALGYSLGPAGRTREAAEAYEQALDVAQALDDHAEAHVMANNLATMYARQGRYHEALALVTRARAWASALGTQASVSLAVGQLTRGQLCSRLGLFDEALREHEDAIAALVAAGASALAARARTSQARTWLALGQTAKAQQALSTWPDGVRGGRLAHELARVAIDKRLRRPVLDRLVALRALDDPAQGAIRMALELEIARETGGDEGLRLALAVEAAATAEGTDTMALQARLARLDVLLGADRIAEALPLARTAAADLGVRWPMGIDTGEIFWLLHRAFEAGGDAERARQTLFEGRDWIADVRRRHVPPALRSGFEQRHPFNALVVAKAAGVAAAQGQPAD